MEIKILKNILESNSEEAENIKKILSEKNIFMIDVMGSPGGGKTTTVSKIIQSLKDKYRIAVIEADMSTQKDSQKLSAYEIPIIQIETNLFGRECHIESSWVKHCLEDFNLDALDLIIIENIGNLICPAEFELGEDIRVVVLSITEGEDKPVKYPMMFNTSHTTLLNKIDLLPHLSYDLDEVKQNLKSVNPGMPVFEVSAVTGKGFNNFINFISEKIDIKKSQIPV